MSTVMSSTGFIARCYQSISPKHRRAARQRQREYKARFDQLKQENETRVQRISQLRGDADTADFLYDSAHGTGAARSRNSIHDFTMSRSHTTLADTMPQALSASSTGSSSYASSVADPLSSRRSTSATSHAPMDHPPAYDAQDQPQPSTRRHSAFVSPNDEWYLPTQHDPLAQPADATQVLKRTETGEHRELRMSAMMA